MKEEEEIQSGKRSLKCAAKLQPTPSILAKDLMRLVKEQLENRFRVIALRLMLM